MNLNEIMTNKLAKMNKGLTKIISKACHSYSDKT